MFIPENIQMHALSLVLGTDDIKEKEDIHK